MARDQPGVVEHCCAQRSRVAIEADRTAVVDRGRGECATLYRNHSSGVDIDRIGDIHGLTERQLHGRAELAGGADGQVGLGEVEHTGVEQERPDQVAGGERPTSRMIRLPGAIVVVPSTSNVLVCVSVAAALPKIFVNEVRSVVRSLVKCSAPELKLNVEPLNWMPPSVIVPPVRFTVALVPDDQCVVDVHRAAAFHIERAGAPSSV